MKDWHKILLAIGLVLGGVVFAAQIRKLPVLGSKLPTL